MRTAAPAASGRARCGADCRARWPPLSSRRGRPCRCSKAAGRLRLRLWRRHCRRRRRRRWWRWWRRRRARLRRGAARTVAAELVAYLLLRHVAAARRPRRLSWRSRAQRRRAPMLRRRWRVLLRPPLELVRTRSWRRPEFAEMTLRVTILVSLLGYWRWLRRHAGRSTAACKEAVFIRLVLACELHQDGDLADILGYTALSGIDQLARRRWRGRSTTRNRRLPRRA